MSFLTSFFTSSFSIGVEGEIENIPRINWSIEQIDKGSSVAVVGWDKV